MGQPSQVERERRALANLRQALKGSGIAIASIRRTADGYHVVFRRDRVERGIDDGVLEDGPATEKIRRLVLRVRRALGG